jgi:methylated-DNA-[protein]-cysteine S-methyltransferase
MPDVVIDSPVGLLRLTASGHALTGVALNAEGVPTAATPDGVLGVAVRQLGEYFAGSRRAFDLPLEPAGTPFQQRVWMALVEIPFGETAAYGEIASRIGRPDAVRAVGAANGQNPIPIIIPCHRVIGADGSMTGFGGGLPMKRWLLAHERSRGQQPLF